MRTDMEKTIYVECPCCRHAVPKVKFCVECGAPLENAKETEKPDDSEKTKLVNGQGIVANQKKTAEKFDESGMTLIMDCCRKTLATVGGDGYTEVVLYRNPEGEYEVHTFMNYAYMDHEDHKAYRADAELYDEIAKIIDEVNLVSWKDVQGFPLCGGDYVIKFSKDGQIYRFTTANMPGNGMEVYSRLSGLLYTRVSEDNLI